MNESKTIEVSIFGTKLTLLTDKPEELISLAEELDNQITELAAQYPGAKQNMILTLACLRYLEDNQKIKKDTKHFLSEREKINNAIQSFLYNIDL